MVTTGAAEPNSQSDDKRTLIDEQVTVRTMAELRHQVLRLAAHAGLPTERAQAFAAAVHEAVANAIAHAQGGELAVVQDDQRRLIAEVRDAGPGMPCAVAFTLPPPEATSGRGMWLAGELADHIDVHANPHGTTVRLEMDL
jgi:serine/threonine-protein kinase RsbW